jgi:hypothetical protein
MSKSISFFLLLYLGFTYPSLAHNVKNNNNVGGTFHIEPKHNPRAGEPSLAWFALTSKGGKLIPLEDCNCQLKVSLEKDGKEKTIATPNLKPISTENYQNIPSATITFPNAGIYKLSISGKPQSGNSFSPFELSYEVVVSGNNSQKEEVQQYERSAEAKTAKIETIAETNDLGFGWILGGIIAIGGLIFVASNKHKK